MDAKTEVNLITIGVLLALIFILRMINATEWNNGYCSCGGKWVYQQAVGHIYKTTYFYECDSCGKTKEFYEKY